MKEVLVMMASATPEDVLLEKLQNDLNDYKTIPSEDNRNHLLMSCQILIIKSITSDSQEKAMDMIKDMNKFEKEREFFKTNDN